MSTFLWLVLSGVIAWLLVGRRQAPGRVPAWRYEPMTLYVGVPGSGKSYRLTWGIVRSLAQGRHVRVNFSLRPSKLYIALRLRYRLSHEDAQQAITRITYIRTWADILDSYDCDVFIDECQMLLNSREWNMVPAAIVEWSATHRHRLCTVTLAAHRFGTIESTIREGHITRIFLTRKAPFLRRLGRKMVARSPYPLLQYFGIKEDEDDSLQAGQKRKGFFRALNGNDVQPLDPVIAACYDSTGGVFPSPLAATRAEKGKDHGLSLQERHADALASSAVDGLPALSEAELVEAIREKRLPSATLAPRFLDLRAA